VKKIKKIKLKPGEIKEISDDLIAEKTQDGRIILYDKGITNISPTVNTLLIDYTINTLVEILRLACTVCSTCSNCIFNYGGHCTLRHVISALGKIKENLDEIKLRRSENESV